MKMTKILSLVIALIMIAACFTACPAPQENIEITLWVSTTAGVKEFTEQQVAAFKAAHPEYQFTITIQTVGEGDAASEVLKDVATAPDMYCFAQDQISRLVQGGALAAQGRSAPALQAAPLPAQCHHHRLPPEGLSDLRRGHGPGRSGPHRGGPAHGRRHPSR